MWPFQLHWSTIRTGAVTEKDEATRSDKVQKKNNSHIVNNISSAGIKFT